MSSQYSTSLKLELIGNGDQSGTWGTTTNNNLGTLLEQAITGVQSITMSNADYTLSNYNGTSDEARNAVLSVTGTNSAIRKIVAPQSQNKLYTIYNGTTGGYAITIGAPTGTAVTIPSGVTATVYTDGSNFYSAQTGSAGNFTVNGTLTATGLTDTGNMSVGGTLSVTGTTTFTGIPSGPTASPGTNTTQLATTAFVNAATGTLGTMATQNANNVAITGGSISGLSSGIPVASGGTGSTSLAANNVLLGNGTAALQVVAPGTTGNVLTSNGTTWTSAAATIKGLGFGGETWQDVSSSRNQSQNYTAPSYPIMVSVGTPQTFPQHQIVAIVNSVTVATTGGGSNNYTSTQNCSFIVPANATYQVQATGSGGIGFWTELR
jgi:hypothetical protein